MTNITQFQAGREAAIAGLPRDGRRSADWLAGWDQAEIDRLRGVEDAARRVSAALLVFGCPASDPRMLTDAYFAFPEVRQLHIEAAALQKALGGEK